jgi:phosphoenolpyruvate-protein kinase (PTS system EI component)
MSPLSTISALALHASRKRSPVPYLRLQKDGNPFLGLRAIRLCLRDRDLFTTQLRALVRASSFDKLGVMFPMISSIEELRAAKYYRLTRN